MLPCCIDPEVQAKLAQAPAMEVANLAEWHTFERLNVADDVEYTIRAARLIQLAMSSGKPLAEVASGALCMAEPPDGITGYTYRIAVQALSNKGIWPHGEEFARWMESRKPERR